MIFKYFLDFIPLCTKKSNTVKTNVFDVTKYEMLIMQPKHDKNY